jgi:hypothetical protein
MDRIAWHQLDEKYAHLRHEFEEHGARIEDDPDGDGLALWVADTCIARVSAEALRLGLQMEDQRNEN